MDCLRRHQAGFIGVLLGGIVFEQFGSYTPIWWLSLLFGVLSALISLPIVETRWHGRLRKPIR
jgi:uncharacterized membrane protein YeaQ/YmgE (transglycosylase-associated protein family)